MALDDGIDPRLRDAPASTSKYPAPALATESHPNIRLPHPPQKQHQQQPQHQYSQWPQDGGGYTYYGPPPDLQHPQMVPPNGYQPYQDPSMPSQIPRDGGLGDSKRMRACEACRGLKVRCEPNPIGGSCKRCLKAGRACQITAPSRKRQKKTDTRVAELERKIDALTSRLNETKEGQELSGSDGEDTLREGAMATTPANPSDTQRQYSHLQLLPNTSLEAYQQQSPHTSAITGYKRRATASLENYAGNPQSHLETNTNPLPTEAYRESSLSMGSLGEVIDKAKKRLSGSTQKIVEPQNVVKTRLVSCLQQNVVENGIVSAEMAVDLFNRFTMEMAILMPSVVFLQKFSEEELRITRPLLYHAVLVAASGHFHPKLQVTLTLEFLVAAAYRITIQGDNGLEVLQALEVFALWFWPPIIQDPEYVHLAQIASMAGRMDVDQAVRTYNGGCLTLIPQASAMPKSVDLTSVNGQHAWLGCYVIESRASMGLRSRAPIPLQRVNDFVELLVSSKEYSYSQLCWLAKLQFAADTLSQTMSQGIHPYGLTVSKIQSAYQDFKLRLQDFERNVPADERPPNLALTYHGIRMYMHELVHKMLKEEVPSEIASSSGGTEASKMVQPDVRLQEISVPAGVEAHLKDTTKGTKTAIQSFIMTFKVLQEECICALPVIHLVHAAHGAVSLMRLHVTTLSHVKFQEEVGLDISTVDLYLNYLITTMRNATAGAKGSPLHNFLVVITELRNWLKRSDLAKLASVIETPGRDSNDTPAPGLSALASAATASVDLTSSAGPSSSIGPINNFLKNKGKSPSKSEFTFAEENWMKILLRETDEPDGALLEVVRGMALSNAMDGDPSKVGL